MSRYGLMHKNRSTTTTAHLRSLIMEYVDIRAKVEGLNRTLAIDDDVIRAFAAGPEFQGAMSQRSNLGLIYERWVQATAHSQVKAHHHVYTLNPETTHGRSHGSLSRLNVAYALGALRAFQAWARPDAELSLLVGYHCDRDHPHAHALIMPRDSAGRPLNFSRLAPVKTTEGARRIDFQGYLQRAYDRYLRHFEAPDRSFEKNPALAILTPKMQFDDWLCALHATFNNPDQTQPSPEELLQRFASSKRDFFARLKAADALRKEAAQMRDDLREKGTVDEIKTAMADRLTKSREDRDERQKKAEVTRPPSPTPEDNLAAQRARIRNIRQALIETDTNRLRQLYVHLRTLQLSLPNHLIEARPVEEKGRGNETPLERTLQRCLMRMQQLNEDRRVLDIHKDANVALSPFEDGVAVEAEMEQPETTAEPVHNRAPEAPVQLPRISAADWDIEAPLTRRELQRVR